MTILDANQAATFTSEPLPDYILRHLPSNYLRHAGFDTWEIVFVAGNLDFRRISR